MLLKTLQCAAMAAIITVATTVQAQSWPTATVKIIVPFTQGTGMDTIARTVARRAWPSGWGRA